MNKPAQHTPGPWKQNDTGVQLWIEPRVCIMVDFPKEKEELEANARLIAAAPELLAAADAIMNDYKTSTKVRLALAIIAAAEGRDAD